MTTNPSQNEPGSRAAAAAGASPSRSGAFTEAVDARVEKFTESISFDFQLADQDIRCSTAHARMLAAQGILTEAEAESIAAALAGIGERIAAGEFVWETRLEDVHMHIEQALIERLGDVGRKLHTARSRNDQVATDLRLWVRDAIDRTDGLLERLQRAFVDRCSLDEGVVLPAYTHLRRAQPVLACHVWLAWCEKLERDRQRLADCRRRTNLNPLGCAALAGTSLPVDRWHTARALGFEGVSANSLDVSSDRDFVLEFAFVLSLIAIHLSAWAEEWILWSTTEFDCLELPHGFCTGSSIMPQKINPDVLELTRGKSARVIGSLQTLLVLTKGLPLAYNRDLQEDKPAILDAARTVGDCLELAEPLVRQARLKPDSINRRLEDGFLDATALMEYLIKKGVPQRSAHHWVGEWVREATARGCRLADFRLEEFQSRCPAVESSIYDVLGARNAVRVLTSEGSSGPEQVARQLQLWRDRFAAQPQS